MGDYFPTKYDSAAAEVIAGLASVSEGYGREETGDVESPAGYVQRVTLDHSCDLDWQHNGGGNYPAGDPVGDTAREYGVTPDDVIGHHVVVTNEQGFVMVQTYHTADAADIVFRHAEERYAAWSADADD